MGSGGTGLVRRHRLVAFFVLAYALSWGFWPLSAWFGFPIPFFPGGPLLAALIVVALTDGRPGLKALGARMVRWRVRWYWYVVAIALPFVVHAATIVLQLSFGATIRTTAELGPLSGVLSALVLRFAVRLIDPSDGPLGEEPGWRAFAVPRLQADRSPGGAVLILAPLVAGWHIPLIFLSDMRPMELVTTMAVTVWYVWLFDRSGGSGLMTLLAHAAEGTLQTGMLWSDPADLARVPWIYGAVWCVVALGLLAFDRGMWRARPAGSPVAVAVGAG